MRLVTEVGWREGTVVPALCAFALLLQAFLLMRDDPASVGRQPYGGPLPAPELGPAPAGGRGGCGGRWGRRTSGC